MYKISFPVTALLLVTFLILLMPVFIANANASDSDGDAQPDNLAFNQTTAIEQSAVKISTGKKSGYFTYQIGGPISNGIAVQQAHFPISELIFPLNVKTVQFSYFMQLKNQWRIETSLETNYSTGSGTMEDSDWGVASDLVDGATSNPDSLDAFSESRSELQLYEAQLHIERYYSDFQAPFGYESLGMYIGLGFTVAQYDFSIFDVRQIYPSLSLDPVSVDGKVLTYEYTLFTPYASVLFKTPEHKKSNLSVKLSLSPFAYITDYDDHILREKLSNGSSGGLDFKAEFQFGWRLTKTDEIFFNYAYQLTSATGWQTQTSQEILDSGADEYKLKLKHDGEQVNIKIGWIVYL